MPLPPYGNFLLPTGTIAALMPSPGLLQTKQNVAAGGHKQILCKLFT